MISSTIYLISFLYGNPNLFCTVVLAASHGTRKLTDFEIEKEYGRDRRKHPGTDYIQHLKEFGPQRLVEFSPLLHSFMDYFDLAAPLLCARIVDGKINYHLPLHTVCT